MDTDFELQGVRHSYGGVGSLSGIDLRIERGEHVAIVGANGSGKSTLLKILDGLVFPSEGIVRAFGAPLTEEALEEPDLRREFRSKVGLVFQDADVQLFCANGFEELAFGPLQLGMSEEQVLERVSDVASRLGIEKLLDRPPYALSGGEKKRLSIGAVLAMEPAVLLLDEPTNALDPRSQVWLLEVLEEWKRLGRTVVIATHDLSVAAEAADRMIVLSEEHRAVADGLPEEVLEDTQLLLAANLIHEHAHRHRAVAHVHAHAHALHEHSADDTERERRAGA